MRELLLSNTCTLVALLLAPGVVSAQAPPPRTGLSIAGHAGKVPVIQVDGKSYVEVEALARLANGSISYKATQITLALSASAPDTEASQEDRAKKAGFSKDFLKAAIEEITVIREWRVAVLNALQHNFPVTEDWIGGYRMAADSKLALASAAVGTDSDRNAIPLISNEFGNMQKLSDRYLAMHKNLTYVRSDALDSDPLDQQIVNCARSLASLVAGGQFQDVATCH